MWYKIEKGIYDDFCAEKIAQIPNMTQSTMKEAIQCIKEERLLAFCERFALCASKRLNLSGFLPGTKLMKQQKVVEPAKNPINSPLPVLNDNKENSLN
jgi:hypothetical protein